MTYVCPYSDAELCEARDKSLLYVRRGNLAAELVDLCREIAGPDAALMLAGLSFSLGQSLTADQLRGLSGFLSNEASLHEVVMAKDHK